MKKNLLICILLALSKACAGQNVLDSIHPLFTGDINGDEIRKVFTHAFSRPGGGGKVPRVIVGIFYSNKLSGITGLNNTKIAGELRKIKQGINVNGDLVFVCDSIGIIVTAGGIDHQNAYEFEFRVMENGKRIAVPWRSIKLFCQTYSNNYKPDGSEYTEDAYLGEFKTSFGNYLTIEVRERNDTLKVSSASAYWMNKTPKVIATFSNTEMPVFLSVFKQQWKHDFFPIGATAYGDIEAGALDSMMIKRNEFKPNENNLIFYLDDKIRSGETELIEYNLISGKKQSGWRPNGLDFNLVWLRNLEPGKYKLQLRYSVQRHNVSEYEFTIAPAWHQTATAKIIAVILAIGLVGFIILLFRSRRQNQKIRAGQLQKQQIQNELKSIHSQFNPHFVFNALSSIQALITKNDPEAADKYLSEFSSLLRDSLKNSGKEMVSLSLETKMLDSYLKLEQLRFGFNYRIEIDESIDKNAVEIPVLLLQPLLENSVKHGISSLYERGAVNISFKRASNDMVVTIADNGKGYDMSQPTVGFGLKLTHDRIGLLNKILKEQTIMLTVNSSATGTSVDIQFKNWLS